MKDKEKKCDNCKFYRFKGKDICLNPTHCLMGEIENKKTDCVGWTDKEKYFETITMSKTDRECCDNCIHYLWYYDKCTKYNCEVDSRSVCNCFVPNKKEC